MTILLAGSVRSPVVISVSRWDRAISSIRLGLRVPVECPRSVAVASHRDGRNSEQQQQRQQQYHGENRRVREQARRDDEADRLRKLYSPSLSLGVEDTVFKILEALQNNNTPYYDFGIEILYRFSGAHCAPFGPSMFFGRPLDLGQFERFRRVMNTEKLRMLIGHTDMELLSRLDLSETKTKVRVKVSNAYTKVESVFEFTLEREIGGRYDGIWFCSCLLCDEDSDGRHVYGVV
jgi:hypothetical protein